ncbi:GGDEF domain-containing protein [Vibrio tritonius]|uniref:diguanylate cyclase n=1 Tax=Vibrio tritonius TaxID=1435069 RepID=A0ABS7YTG5_9VIBR|nr:GGDEF domain-containing protein [Vibrio tritonius]MCA2018926.1 GGDEF domain-containing protein [Vibrio tritonius]
MEALLNKVQDAGYDITTVSGVQAIEMWNEIRIKVATEPNEQALCHIISSEHQLSIQQLSKSIDELNQALSILTNIESSYARRADLVLMAKNALSERYLTQGDYAQALKEYVSITQYAIEHGDIDTYASAILGMGKLCESFGDANRALRYYQKIDHVDHALSSRSLRLHYKLHKLSCFVTLNKLPAAREILKECEELSILVSDKLLTGQIMLYQSQLHRQHGNLSEALRILANIPYAVGNIRSNWFACKSRIEQARCLLPSRPALATYLLDNAQRRLQHRSKPELKIELYQAYSDIYAERGLYKESLFYEKLGFETESHLISQIPIADLGANQLRRLARFDLQLKLILSEMENRELKETTESQKHEVAQLQQDVFTDPLTQLKNRRWMESCLKELLIHETEFAFLVVDIDHFKSINDELSHLAGDKAIVNVSTQILQQFNRPGHHCVRFGGEEFLVIVENVDLNQALVHAEELRKNIEQLDWKEVLGERRLTVSVGVTLHRLGENTQRTFYRADKALYRAKANGRNQVCSE